MDKKGLIRRSKNAEILKLQENALVRNETKFHCKVPCVRGHIGLRYTLTGQCVRCKSEISKKCNEIHREDHSKSRRAHYAENKSEILERKREYRRANAAKVREWRLKYYWSDPDKHRKRSKDFYHRDLARSRRLAKKSYQRNKESYRERKAELARECYFRDVETSRRKSRNRGYIRREVRREGVGWSVFRDWSSYIPKVCFYCGVSCEKMYHVDHFIPLSRGGAHVLTNLRVACPSCNLSKAAKLPAEIEDMLCVHILDSH